MPFTSYKNYLYKQSELVYEGILLPSHAPDSFHDRATLWNAVEKVEKQCNAQYARNIIIALPNELPTDQLILLVKEYCMNEFVSKGMCCDIAIHDKGDGNPHAHILLTMRALDEHSFQTTKGRNIQKGYANLGTFHKWFPYCKHSLNRPQKF